LLYMDVQYNLAYVWIRLFLMRGVDPCVQDTSGLTAAHYACERDDVEMLKALTLPFHANVKALPDNMDNDGDTCLHYTVVNNDLELSKYLIQVCGANVNGGDEQCPSPLDIQR
ncbi:unnamed protein product, partial [Didymodactylos carnosus]